MKITEQLKKHIGKIYKGQEVPDPVPLFVELGLKPEMTIEERVNRLVRSNQWNEQMSSQGVETFEEANDFNVGGADEVTTPYQDVLMAEEFPIEPQPTSEPVVETAQTATTTTTTPAVDSTPSELTATTETAAEAV